MNILMNCLSSLSGGAVTYLRNLTPLLAEIVSLEGNRHSLKFLAHEVQAPLLEGVENSAICWVRGTRPKDYHRLSWERRNLLRTVVQEGVDVLFTPYQISPRVQKVKQVLMLRNMEPFLFNAYRYSLKNWLRNKILRWASVRCLRGADRIITVSEFVREHAIQNLGVAEGVAVTIYHGKPNILSNADEAIEQTLIEKIGIENDFILTCGSLLPYRRCEDVIASFNQYASALGTRMQLVIAGSGTDFRYWETIKLLIAASPLRDQILVVGHVPWDTMAALYRRCAACVIATEIEACPNIAIEGMAAGSLIVAADRAPLPEIFQGCALEYRARDIDHLTQQLRQAVENNPLRSEIKAKALKRAEHFSWQKCATETYAVLAQWP